MTLIGCRCAVWLIPAALALAPLDSAPAQAPDRVYINAKAWTADDARPLAQAFAVRAGRFLAVGSDAEILALAGPATTIVDLGGRLVLPGFNDAHWHFPGSRGADLDGAENVAEIRKRLGLKDRAHVRDRYIDPALAEGMIEMTIPDRPSSRLQEYRLSEKGRAWLDARSQ